MVFEGHHEEGHKGFGARHLREHDDDIRTWTPFSSWQELVGEFFNALKVAPKKLDSGSIYPNSSPGRTVFLWDDERFAQPVTIVMDAMTGTDRGQVNHYSLITAYPSEKYVQPPGAPNQSRGIPSLHGSNILAQSFKDYLRPDVARRFTESETRRAAVDGSTNSHTEAEAAALDDMPWAGTRSRKNLFQALFSGPDRLVGDSEAKKRLIVQLRSAFLDRYDAIREQGGRAHKAAMEQGKAWAYMLADTSAHAAALAVDRAAGYFSATMKYGQMVFRDGIGSVENIEWYKKDDNGEYVLDADGKRQVEHVGLRNTVTAKFFDPATQQLVSREVTVDGLYEEGGDAGLIPIFNAIATPSNMLVREFFAYAIALRGYRLSKSGKRIPLSQKTIETALGFADKHPEIAVAHANYIQWNEGLINFQLDTGVIDEDMAQTWRETADYIPYFVGLEGDTTEAIEEVMKVLGKGPDATFIDSLVGVSAPKKLKGHDKEMMEPIEAISKNTMAAITAGLRNQASQRALRDARILGTAKYIGGERPPDSEDIVRIRLKGKDAYFWVQDNLVHQALTGAMDGYSPLGGILTKPSQWLRELVTRTPEFMVANMMRDSLSVWTINQGDSGNKIVGDFVPIASSFTQFGRGLRAWKRGEVTEQYKQLEKHGVLGGYELSRLTDRELTRYFAKKIGTKDYKKALLGLDKAWDVLGEASARSEASTRELIYESTFHRVYQELTNQGFEHLAAERKAQGEAAFQAQEILNFSRHGNSTWLRWLTSVVPFMNSRLQGLDVMARNVAGASSLRSDPSAVRKSLIVRGMLLSTMTMLYTMMMYEDEEWLKQRPTVRDDYWLIPMPGGKLFSLPIPFEAGVIFKVLPEMMTRLMLGGSSREAAQSAKHAAMSTLNFNPIPQAVKPALETFVNYNFFTGRPIVPHYMENMVGGVGARPSTSALAQIAGKTIGGSPLKYENLFRGYMGGMGTYALQATDTALRLLPTGLPGKPFPRLTDFPFFRRFIRDEYAGGMKSDYYDLKKSIEGVVNTVNYLERNDPAAALDMRMEYMGLLQVADMVRDIDKSLADIRDQQQLVWNSSLDSFAKRNMVDQLERQANMHLSNINVMRRMADMPMF